MCINRLLRELQTAQREHDVKAHKDVYFLPNQDRIKHLTLHIAKYAGRMSRKEVTKREVAATLVDGFIITLSAAECLGIELSASLGELLSLDQHSDLKSLGLDLSKSEGIGLDFNDWYFRKLADTAGRMSKACEALDHIESFPYREVLSSAAVDLCRTSLIAAAILDVNLDTAVRERWREIESKRESLQIP
jgi:hypothetical protein